MSSSRCLFTALLCVAVAADFHEEELGLDGSHLEGPDHEAHQGFMADPNATPKRVYTMRCHRDVWEFHHSEHGEEEEKPIVDCSQTNHPLLKINGPLCDVAKMTACTGYETRLEPAGKWITMIRNWDKIASEGRLTNERINTAIHEWEHRAQDSLRTLHDAAAQPDATAEEKHDFKDPYNHSPLIHQQWMTLHILYQYRDWLHELQRQGKDPRKESIHEHIHDEM